MKRTRFLISPDDEDAGSGSKTKNTVNEVNPFESKVPMKVIGENSIPKNISSENEEKKVASENEVHIVTDDTPPLIQAMGCFNPNLGFRGFNNTSSNVNQNEPNLTEFEYGSKSIMEYYNWFYDERADSKCLKMTEIIHLALECKEQTYELFGLINKFRNNETIINERKKMEQEYSDYLKVKGFRFKYYFKKCFDNFSQLLLDDIMVLGVYSKIVYYLYLNDNNNHKYWSFVRLVMYEMVKACYFEDPVLIALFRLSNDNFERKYIKFLHLMMYICEMKMAEMDALPNVYYKSGRTPKLISKRKSKNHILELRDKFSSFRSFVMKVVESKSSFSSILSDTNVSLTNMIYHKTTQFLSNNISKQSTFSRRQELTNNRGVENQYQFYNLSGRPILPSGPVTAQNVCSTSRRTTATNNQHFTPANGETLNMLLPQRSDKVTGNGSLNLSHNKNSQYSLTPESEAIVSQPILPNVRPRSIISNQKGTRYTVNTESSNNNRGNCQLGSPTLISSPPCNYTPLPPMLDSSVSFSHQGAQHFTPANAETLNMFLPPRSDKVTGNGSLNLIHNKNSQYSLTPESEAIVSQPILPNVRPRSIISNRKGTRYTVNTESSNSNRGNFQLGSPTLMSSPPCNYSALPPMLDSSVSFSRQGAQHFPILNPYQAMQNNDRAQDYINGIMLPQRPNISANNRSVSSFPYPVQNYHWFNNHHY